MTDPRFGVSTPPGDDTARSVDDTPGRVELYWIPLGAGAGGTLVRWSGRIYEAIAAAATHRVRSELYHSALMVDLDRIPVAVEMAPVWVHKGYRGVVAEGPVGSPLLGHSRLFRYEVRRWAGGTIPDVAAATDAPVCLTTDAATSRALLELVPEFPTLTWGRDELSTGDMWNSNSLVSWLLSRSGIPMASIGPPRGGRAPGWDAGIVAASRS